MTIYYSEKINGFYDTDVFGAVKLPDGTSNPDCRIPDQRDLVEIDDNYHAILMEGQCYGKEIAANAEGYPILIDPPKPTVVELARNARNKRELLLKNALPYLERHLYQTSFRIPTTLSDERARCIALYVQALRDVPQQEGFPESIDWPQNPLA